MSKNIKTRRKHKNQKGSGGPRRQLGTIKNKKTQLKYQQFQAKRKQNWEKKSYGAITYKRTLELQKKGYQFPSSEEDNKKLINLVFPELVKSGVKVPSLREIKEYIKTHPTDLQIKNRTIGGAFPLLAWYAAFSVLFGIKSTIEVYDLVFGQRAPVAGITAVTYNTGTSIGNSLGTSTIILKAIYNEHQQQMNERRIKKLKETQRLRKTQKKDESKNKPNNNKPNNNKPNNNTPNNSSYPPQPPQPPSNGVLVEYGMFQPGWQPTQWEPVVTHNGTDRTVEERNLNNPAEGRELVPPGFFTGPAERGVVEYGMFQPGYQPQQYVPPAARTPQNANEVNLNELSPLEPNVVEAENNIYRNMPPLENAETGQIIPTAAPTARVPPAPTARIPPVTTARRAAVPTARAPPVTTVGRPGPRRTQRTNRPGSNTGTYETAAITAAALGATAGIGKRRNNDNSNNNNK